MPRNDSSFRNGYFFVNGPATSSNSWSVREVYKSSRPSFFAPPAISDDWPLAIVGNPTIELRAQARANREILLASCIDSPFSHNALNGDKRHELKTNASRICLFSLGSQTDSSSNRIANEEVPRSDQAFEMVERASSPNRIFASSRSPMPRCCTRATTRASSRVPLSSKRLPMSWA